MALTSRTTEIGPQNLHHSETRNLAFGFLQTAQDDSPEVDPVIQRILFSKHFVPTYYIVLLAVIVVYALRIWQSHRSRNDGRSLRSRVSSDGSVTLTHEPVADNALSQKSALLEWTPLLSHNTRTFERSNGWNRVHNHLKSWLAYQPRPIYAVTAPSNILPCNGVSLLVVLLIAINVFYLFFKNVPPSCGLDAFAIRAGLCAVMNLPVIYVLAAKNNYLLLRITGWSYEGLNLFHRRLSEWTVMLACVHALCMFGVWYTSFIPRGFTWKQLFEIRLIMLGLTSLSCMVLLWVTSIGYVRRRAYELFLAIHVAAQAASLPLLFLHHRNTRWYTGFALCIWLVDRIAIRTFRSQVKLIATFEVDSDQQTVRVYLEIPLSPNGHHASDVRGGWRAGQHVFLTIPSLGFKFRYQRHPFTIASPAPLASVDLKRKWPMQLIVRGKNGFSRRLVEFAKHHQHAEVSIDGPYGSCDALEAIQRADRTCLIAGGSGISVTYPLAWATQIKSDESLLSMRTTYVHGKKHIPRISVHQTMDDERFWHLWINKSEDHSKWISFCPAQPDHKSPSGITEPEMALNLISRTVSTSEGPGVRPDVCTELHTWVRGNLGSQLVASPRVCVVVSGPDELARSVRNSVALLLKEGWNVDIVVEKFNW